MSDLKTKLDRINTLKHKLSLYNGKSACERELVKSLIDRVWCLDARATFCCTSPDIKLSDFEDLDETTDWCAIPAFKQGF